jgi:hypothetical protein
MSDVTDVADPAVRAQQRLARSRRRQAHLRGSVSALLLVAAGATIAVAADLAHGDGAWVGVVVLVITLIALASAAGPYEWGETERRQRQLDAIWRTLRGDDETPWTRYLAWAVAGPRDVELRLITRQAAGHYREEPAEHVAIDDTEAAAEAMERLRELAADRELRARLDYDQAIAAAEHRAQDDALAEVDQTAAEYERRRDHELRRELAVQEAAEQRAQAEALARALRQP